jgi:hypothetical protein
MVNPYVAVGARVRYRWFPMADFVVTAVSDQCSAVSLGREGGWHCVEDFWPVVRVKAPTRMYGNGVPDDAQPNDLVVGNRGAAALVVELVTSGPLKLRYLSLQYVGNWYEGARPTEGHRVYDFSGGTRP